jgi:N-acyl amino acid synthase of PEP-CTERM/exosortase system
MSLQSALQVSEMNDAAQVAVTPGGFADLPLIDDTLLGRFNSHFDILPADTMERVRAAQRVRYQVYCIEHPHEKPSDDEGLEIDEFDAHAAQSLLIYRRTNSALGTLRLILPLANDLEHSFPVQQVLDEDCAKRFSRLPLHSMGEISRFSISRRFRSVADASTSEERIAFVSNSSALMRLGLMQALVRMSVQHGITHWCAAVEPTFQRMLAAMAIRFHPIGPLVEFHGLRQPVYGAVDDILNAVKRNRPAFWAVLTDAGSLYD